jgi:cell division protein FtsI (penicillin-binding protein 3)
MTRPANDRIVGVLLAGLFLLGLLWVRCAWLQVFGAKHYTAIARQQHSMHETITAPRGTIYDAHGQPLAMSVLAPSVYANARQVAAKRDMARQLSKLVDRDAQFLQQRLEQDRGFVWLARQVDPALTPALLPLRRAGVGIREEPKRLYPHQQLASHVLGFVNIDQRGLEGLELAYNGMLQGRDGWRATWRDAKGEQLVGPWTTEVAPVPGHDMVLTIDAVVQQVAEETLEWGLKKYHAKGGSIIVMDPRTGAIWAMANAPTYDNGAPASVPPEKRRNRAITDVFEPGSIFKIVTASALLQEGRITPQEQIFCEQGAWPTVARHVLHDHHGHGLLTFHDIIKNSSNIGTSKAAQRLKPEEFYRYVRAFGFGQKTGLEIPGEVSGLLSPPSRWSKLTPYIMPIGQEIAATPIQLAVMTAVVANGGLRVSPYLVKDIQTANGHVVRSYAHKEPVRILSAEVAQQVSDMLVSVVESGTGQLANVKGLTVAGKTGTAQKLEPTGRYSHSRFVASFVGYGPVPDPRFVMVVSMDEPRPLYFGGVVSAPMFKRMVEQLAGYWELAR